MVETGRSLNLWVPPSRRKDNKGVEPEDKEWGSDPTENGRIPTFILPLSPLPHVSLLICPLHEGPTVSVSVHGHGKLVSSQGHD